MVIQTKKSLFFDRKFRIKFKLYEQKKKIYHYISKETAKDLLLFLKQKRFTGLSFSLEDQLFINTQNFFICKPNPLTTFTHSVGQTDSSLTAFTKPSNQLPVVLTDKKSKILKLLDPGYFPHHNDNLSNHSFLNNILSFMIFNHFSRLFKKLQKKSLFFSTRKLPTAVKIKNRCLITSGSRSIYRKLKMGRQALKKHIHLGSVPSFTKSSF